MLIVSEAAACNTRTIQASKPLQMPGTCQPASLFLRVGVAATELQGRSRRLSTNTKITLKLKRHSLTLDSSVEAEGILMVSSSVNAMGCFAASELIGLHVFSFLLE
jgi:hypothetical protein